ncbi:hypothetical protein C8Q79DRAFT_122116 [Trametes meyenii]|nr:hypothetical protein C8Q79DRAFT_122116 [Trametes meyenii]
MKMITPQRRLRVTPSPAKDAAIATAGASIGMMGDLFRDFQAILDAGLQAADTPSPPTALSYREQKYSDLFRMITTLIPWVADEIAERGPKGTFEVARLLDSGRSSVRTADISGVKRAILTWNTYEPIIHPDAKSTRGFNHPECGRLLCPVGYDWKQSEVRTALQNGSRKYPTGARKWPIVLWQEEKVNLDDLNEGFLRNRRLVMAGRHSLLGPRASKHPAPGKLPARKPKAKIHRIRSISVGFVAYTAVLVHFSLHSQESFADGATPGTYPYEVFYQTLVRYVEETMDQAQRTELLDWWTSEVFGNLEDDGDCSTEDDENSGRPPSILSRMKAQAAARRTSGSSSVANSAPAADTSANQIVGGEPGGSEVSASATGPSDDHP